MTRKAGAAARPGWRCASIAKGGSRSFPAPPRAALPTSRVWRIDRGTRCHTGFQARIDRTLEDTPFYARAVIRTGVLEREVTAVHESLNLDRFASGWVQAMLPVRMPRVLW